MSDQTIIVLVVIGAVVIILAAFLLAQTSQRRRRLKQQFGPEYDRTVDAEDDRRAAEARLRERQERHEKLDIRSLDGSKRDVYSDRWIAVQEHFVDDPRSAVAEAGTLLTAVMHDRGYPTDEGYDQRLADLSVEHGRTLSRYRMANEISERAERNEASTEELRRAMVDYRALFDELLEAPVSTSQEGRRATAGRQTPPPEARPPAEDDTGGY